MTCRRLMGLALVALTVWAPTGHAQVTCPKIDVHQHAHPLSVWRSDPAQKVPILCENDRVPCTNPPSKFQTDEALLEGTLEYMRRHNIVRAYVGSEQANVERWLKAAPDRFVGGLSFDSPGFSVDVARQLFTSKAFGLLGELGNQYQGIPPNHPSLEPYWALAEELDVPVSIHTAGIGARTPTFRVGAGSPLLLEDVLTRHPKVRVYVENAGYPFGDEMIAMLYMYPQLYADVSTIGWLIPRTAYHDYLRRLVRAGFGDRLMFGSDQMAWPETIGMGVEAIESADFLTPAQRCDIFFNNAVRFFRLDAEALGRASWP